MPLLLQKIYGLKYMSPSILRSGSDRGLVEKLESQFFKTEENDLNDECTGQHTADDVGHQKTAVRLEIACKIISPAGCAQGIDIQVSQDDGQNQSADHGDRHTNGPKPDFVFLKKVLQAEFSVHILHGREHRGAEPDRIPCALLSVSCRMCPARKAARRVFLKAS